MLPGAVSINFKKGVVHLHAFGEMPHRHPHFDRPRKGGEFGTPLLRLR